MVRIVSAHVSTAHGNAEETLAAIQAAQAHPASVHDMSAIGGNLVDRLREDLLELPADLLVLASTKGDLETYLSGLRSGSTALQGSPGILAQEFAESLGIRRGIAVSNACAAGPAALGMAARHLLSGKARRIVVMGIDYVHGFILDGFEALHAIDAAGCTPFDANRQGLRVGDGIAAILLEAEENGPAQSVSPVQEGIQLLGWGDSLDANHLTGPCRDGSGLARAVRSCLKRSNHDQPDVIVAHGTGTKYNDASELAAYGSLAMSCPLTAWKGVLGHGLGASGIIETALIVTAMQRGLPLPGIAHMRQAADSVQPLVPSGATIPSAGPVLKTAAGFGGMNSAVLVGRGHTPESTGQHTPQPVPAPVRSERIHLEVDESGHLTPLTAKAVLGRAMPTWGRMDLSCRALVALVKAMAKALDSACELDSSLGIVLCTDSGSAVSDLQFERSRLAGSPDAQRFVYTLPSTPVGEASIHGGIGGPGLVLMGVSDDEAAVFAGELLVDAGLSGVLLSRVETLTTPHCAWAELLSPSLDN